MSKTVPPIPPPPGTNPGNAASPNRVDTIPNDNTNNTSTNNVTPNVVVAEDLPQLLDTRGAYEEPPNTRDTKIVALRLKFNASKVLKGEKVQGTFTRLIILLNDLENKDVYIPQAKMNATFVNSLPRKCDSDVEEDIRSSSEFLADLNAEFQGSTLLANQERFYKRSGRVGSAIKPIVGIKRLLEVTTAQENVTAEVILNGNKVLKRTVRETEQEYEPTTAEEKQDRRNEIKLEELCSRSSSTSQNPQNVAFVSSNSTNSNCNSSTNKADNTAYGVSAAHTQCNPTSGDNLSDAMICAFLASQPNSPQLAREDLEQIDPDDLEEMDLQWEMAMLTIRARRFIQRIGRKCRAPRNQENRGRENSRRIVTVETPTENALVAQDGIGGYDWSYQAEKEHPINFSLMAYTSSRSSSNSYSEVDSCSKSCVKAYATLKEQYDSFPSDYKKSQFNLVYYKAGLESVEARLAHYKKNEAVFEEYSPAVESFVNSSEMLENQENNKSKSDKGYHAVPPPYTRNFIPFKPDLTFMGKIVKSENMDVTTIVTPSNVKKVKSNHEYDDVKNNNDAVEPKTVRKNSFRPPIIEDWNSDDNSEVKLIPNVKDKTVRPSTEKIKFIKSGKINTADASVNTAVRPVNTVGSKTIVNHSIPISNTFKKGYSQVTNSFNKYLANKNNIFNKKVNIVRVKDTIARDRAVVSENMEKGANVVKASSCWAWKSKNNSASNTFKKYSYIDKEYKEKGVIDSGCSRNMTENKCYLTEYEDYDGGFVSFRDAKGRIYGKGKIKTGTLDFDNVYFCKELKYNLFSVSQICDKKNNVLFTDTECLVLSSDFKLLDESQVLLRVPRKDNIYSVDLKSVVPTKGLTCLFAKATINESNLWNRRLGHINFNNMNKLVRGNLVREIENQLDHKVKVIRSDNRTEFKNSVMNQFCEMKGIKREFSIARTPQQNGVAERKNITLIKALRTILPHNKTPYELIRGRTPLIDFMKPFGCPFTILNTRDHLGKFDGKADEGFFVGYSVVNKAMRVFNKRTRIVEKTLNIRFLENAPNVIGNGPDWLFDVDSLTKSMNYVPVVAENQTNGPKDSEEDVSMKPTKVNESRASDKGEEDEQDTRSEFKRLLQQEKQTNSTNIFNTVGTPVSVVGPSFTNDDPSSPVNAAEAYNAFEDHLFE
ncbi:ribonuclease H-like domain-containing protein [Tanacetum coccineum]